MRPILLAMLIVPLAACAQERADHGPHLYLAGEAPDDEAAHLERMKTVIRQDAQVAYAKLCGTLTIPDEAFIPVEITGGGLPELALSLTRADCAAGRTLFSGTDGEVVQLWIGSGGPVRLLLEEDMHGFTPVDGGLIAFQHGVMCPEGRGPDICVTELRWLDVGRRLNVASRRPTSSFDDPPRMEYGYRELAGIE